MSSKRPLSDFISVKHGFAFKGEFFKIEKTHDLLITPGNFAIGGGFKGKKFKYYDGPVPNDYILSEDDLVVTMTDLSKTADTLGYSALVPHYEKNRLLHNQRIGLVEFKNSDLDKYYLYFLLRSKEYRHHVISTATGSTVKHTSPTKILSFEFDLPDLEDQRKAANQLLSLERKINLNRQLNQTLEEMAQAIFKSWFVDFEPVKAKIQGLENGGTEEDANLAAMVAISGKTTQQLQTLKLQSPNEYQQLHQTAQLFPSAMEESELGEIPVGWEVDKIGSILKRLKPSKRYTKKQIEPIGKVPVYEQGAGILMGYHNEEAGFKATPDQPIFIFGDHTCITHLSCSSFDISQNVIPLQGNKYPTIWTYYAIQGKQGFQEYRRHWSELIIKKLVLPDLQITRIFELIVTDNKRLSEAVFNESERLKGIRDTLLPELLSSKGSP